MVGADTGFQKEGSGVAETDTGSLTGISYGSHVGPIWTALWAPLGRPTSDPKQSVRRAEMGPKWATHVGYPLSAQYISSGRQAQGLSNINYVIAY